MLNRYNSVNSQAQQAAAAPFKQYSTDPNAFVAPINAQENTGIAGINASANTAQPYFNAATGQLTYAQNATQPYYSAAGTDIGNAQAVGSGLGGASLSSLLGAQSAGAGLNAAAGQNYGAAYSNAQPFNAAAATGIGNAITGAQPYQAGATAEALAGGQQVNAAPLTSASIMQYLSPYLSTVLGNTSSLINQNNQQQQAGQLGNAISSGAFGGDRAGIAAANLAQQQELAAGNIYSGILNTGYNNALSTAQQQQGVNLGAGQANRAAAQTTAGLLQSIGNQGFTQGLAGAAANQNLGQQIYGQGTGLAAAQQGLGQQEYAQGSNTAAQEAALGQQQFGQGITASQATSGLGQNIYNTGAATSAALANLGAGAQTAGLQGAQAQLGAGQLQQQTTQAGDTALYNQFLQQQSYPFQVAQFLANIAEGTGALSGSTTTTTQPGGFFSDERLKEDIEPIGKTFDGQNIIKFRYKGDPRKQIGLSAQEVEKHHPDAVGLARGYRTVDYDKATADAAERGHFYRGGLTRARYAAGGGPVIEGADLDAILNAQSQMYGPYGGGGLYGGSASGAPRGGSSYVPNASLPVGHLAVAGGAPPPPPSGLQQIKQAADLGKEAGQGLQGLGKLVDKFRPANDDTSGDYSQFADLDNMARGGLARASGGPVDLYSNDNDPNKLDIPDDAPKGLSLAVAGAPPKPQGGGILGTILGLGKDAAQIAGMIPGLATGGVARQGYDDGGSTDDGLSLSDILNGLESGVGGLGSWARGAGRQAGQSVVDAGANLGDVAMGALFPKVGAKMAGQAAANDVARAQGLGAGTDVTTPIDGPIPTPPVHHGLGRAMVPTPADYTPTVGPSDPASYATPTTAGIQDAMANGLPGGLGAASAPNPVAADQALSTPAPIGPLSWPDDVTPNHKPGVLDGIEGALSKIPGAFKKDPNLLPAILSGIAAMGTAPTRSLGVALASGLAGGVSGYQNRQTQLANVANTQAQANRTNAEASRIQVVKAADLALLARSGFVPQPDPNGNIETEDGKRWTLVKSGSLLAGAKSVPGAPGGEPAEAPNYKYLGPTGQGVAANELTSYATAPPEDQGQSRKAMTDVQSTAESARSQLPQLNQYADAMSAGERGILQPGPLNAVKAAWTGNFNDIVRTMGHPEWQVQNEGLTATQIAEKMAIVTAQARAQGADERSLGALNTLLKSVPGNNMTPDAATHMVAQAFVRNQRDIDRANYYAEMNQAVQASGGLPNNFLSRDADQAFGADHTADQYLGEQQKIYNAMSSGAWQKAQRVMQTGTPEQKAALTQAIGPNMVRYLTGGV